MRALTTLEHALLGLLAGRAQSGYQLRKQFAATPMGHFSDSPGSIYPALKRLAQRELISTLPEERTGARGRRLFTVTKQGQRELRRWLRHRVTRGDVVWKLDELMLRFVFTAEVLGAGGTARFLKSLQAELKNYIAELEKFLRNAGGSLPPAGRLAVEQGLEGYRATLRWAARARVMLARRAS